MVDIPKLVHDNSVRWERAQIKPDWRPHFRAIAKSLYAAKARYQKVALKTGVPWAVIAVIHEREASGGFGGVLHNGEKIIGKGVKTKLVPAGRGPFATWEDAAIDALQVCPPYAAEWKDWSPGGTMTLLERYNGVGYALRGLPSPYIWSGTDQYVKGKFVEDHKYDPNTIDKQAGCAGMLLAIAELDQDVAASLGKLPRDLPPSIPPDPKPQPVNPPSLLNVILSIIKAVFSWKK